MVLLMEVRMYQSGVVILRLESLRLPEIFHKQLKDFKLVLRTTMHSQLPIVEVSLFGQKPKALKQLVDLQNHSLIRLP